MPQSVTYVLGIMCYPCARLIPKGWSAIVGWEPEDIGDRPSDWLSLIHPYYAGGVRMDLAAHLKGEKDEFECEYRIRHRDGTYRWVLCRGRAVRDKQDKAIEISGVQTDVTRLIEVENRLVEDALHDRLTGLPNRNFFNAHLQQVIELQRKDPRLRFAVLFLDLDRFKEVNDTLGHLVGDELLASTAKRLRDCLRPDDFVARFGGDEFVVLLEKTEHLSEAQAMTSRIQQELSAPYQLDDHQVVAKASIGIVLSDSRLESAEELIRNADIAMYQAKADGRAQNSVYTPSMYKRTERRWKLENALRKAIDRNELALAYQPQICPQSAKIFGAEALLRWTPQEGPVITPTEFIPLAERSDLILEIGEWVLRRACEDAMNWRRLDPDSAEATKISVNLSARQLLQPEFAEVVKRIVTETGIDPQTLELELTESILIDSLEKAPAVLREIARQGITLAIDDFGTGYCAISYLRKLTANVIKLDRSFVTDVDRDHRAGAIAKGMIGLAHDLGLSVIAEGVEDRQQLSFFQRHRCDLVQGYFTGHPVPAERFQSLLCQNRARVSPDPATSEINSREAEQQVLVLQ